MSNTKLNVLVIDDEPDMRHVLEMMLMHHGCQVITAANGYIALDKLQQHSYHLIFLDYSMPKINGLDLVPLIYEQNAHIKIILMTAYDSAQLQQIVRKMDLYQYIQKPISTTNIQAIVAQTRYELEQAMTVDTEQAYQETGKIANRHLKQLRLNTQAKTTLVLTVEGYLVLSDGMLHTFDVTAVSTLVAAKFMAMSEISDSLGSQSILRSSYCEGSDTPFYVYRINDNYLLVIILGPESKEGIVRLYTKKTANILNNLLHVLPISHTLETTFPMSMEQELHKLFNVSQN